MMPKFHLNRRPFNTATPIFVSMILATALISGCAANKKFVRGEQTVVERSSSTQPDWAMKTTFFRRDGMLCFSGGVTDATDYALARRQAKAAALKNAVESIGLLARTEYTEAIRGNGVTTSGKFIEDAIAFTTQNVDIQGLQPGEEYVEKVEVRLDDGVRYSYNLFAFYQLRESEYQAAKQRALEKMLGNARTQGDKAAEATAARLLNQVKASPEQ